MSKICSVSLAGALDNGFRRWLHDPNKILKDYVKPGMTALDIGCGPGFFTIEMVKLAQGGKVVAADVQQGMLDIVKKKVGRLNITLHKTQENRIGLKKKFDFILAFYMLHEVADKRRFLSELRSILKSGGKMLIVEPIIHVPKKAFQRSMDIAGSLGFKIKPGPKVFFSRSIVLE